MFRGLIKKAIGLYLLPLRGNDKLFYYVKGTFFTDGTEHLYWATRYIKRRGGGVPKDSIIIDVGGFNGGTALYFASQFEGLKVYCIEPNSKMLPSLKEVEAANERIRVRNIALGAARGEATLHVTSNDLSSSLNELSAEELRRTPESFQEMLREERSIQVRVSTLDDEFADAPPVLLIKLDTQGTELDILKGGTEVLRKTKFVLAEMNNHRFYKNTCQYYEVDEYLRGRGFRLVDVVVSYRGDDGVTEYDALYENLSL
ncbi:MAG TPA: FkbM family methyltransferase [Pyrinomonadaceae bacterium]|jgi:FkbM family methyltransferase